MSKVFGEELRKAIMAEKARYQASIDDRAERIEKGWTDMDDCFLSQRCEERGIWDCDTKLNILDNGGTYDWECYFDQDGKEVSVRWVKTRFGTACVWNGIFASSIKALLKKTGLVAKTVPVPVWTKFVPAGSGLCGVYGGSYQVVRWPTNMWTGEYVGYPD